MGLFGRNNDDDAEQSDTAAYQATITQGVPGRCPECGGFGYIDHLDLVHRSQVQHCRQCRHRWEYRFDEDGELVEMLDLRTPGARVHKVRVGDVTDPVPPAEPATVPPAEPAPTPVTPTVEVIDDSDDIDDDVLDLTELESSAEPAAETPADEETPADTGPQVEAATAPESDDVYAKSPGEWLRSLGR